MKVLYSRTKINWLKFALDKSVCQMNQCKKKFFIHVDWQFEGFLSLSDRQIFLKSATQHHLCSIYIIFVIFLKSIEHFRRALHSPECRCLLDFHRISVIYRMHEQKNECSRSVLMENHLVPVVSVTWPNQFRFLNLSQLWSNVMLDCIAVKWS